MVSITASTTLIRPTVELTSVHADSQDAMGVTRLFKVDPNDGKTNQKDSHTYLMLSGES